MNRFFGTASSVFLVGFTLTPEMTTAMALLIGAIFIGLVNLYGAKTTRLIAMKEIAKAVAPIALKIDEMAPVVDRINVHVNSEKDRALAELKERDLQIELQREMIEEMRKAASLLAQAKATVELTTAVTAAVVGASVPVPTHDSSSTKATDSLEKIDVNTQAIEKNTSKTEATVQELKDKP